MRVPWVSHFELFIVSLFENHKKSSPSSELKGSCDALRGYIKPKYIRVSAMPGLYTCDGVYHTASTMQQSCRSSGGAIRDGAYLAAAIFEFCKSARCCVGRRVALRRSGKAGVQQQL